MEQEEILGHSVIELTEEQLKILKNGILILFNYWDDGEEEWFHLPSWFHKDREGKFTQYLWEQNIPNRTVRSFIEDIRRTKKDKMEYILHTRPFK